MKLKYLLVLDVDEVSLTVHNDKRLKRGAPLEDATDVVNSAIGGAVQFNEMLSLDTLAPAEESTNEV